MKVVIEVTMISGNKYRLTRENKKQGFTAEDMSVEFEKEMLENTFIKHSTDLRLKVSNIESYKVILASKV